MMASKNDNISVVTEMIVSATSTDGTAGWVGMSLVGGIGTGREVLACSSDGLN